MLNRNDWIQLHYPMVQQVTAGTGILPEIALSQAIIESSTKASDGNFYPGTSKLATDGNNLFGIKADKNWKGDFITLPTKEFKDGKWVQTSAKFRKYPSIEDSFKDYVKFLQTNPRYKAAGVFSAKTYQEQAKALQKAGYATDPNYSNLLTGVINSFKKYIPKVTVPFLWIAAAFLLFINFFTGKSKA